MLSLEKAQKKTGKLGKLSHDKNDMMSRSMTGLEEVNEHDLDLQQILKEEAGFKSFAAHLVAELSVERCVDSEFCIYFKLFVLILYLFHLFFVAFCVYFL